MIPNPISASSPGVIAFSQPVQITFPNVFGAAPGTKLNVLSFNHTTGMLEISGSALTAERQRAEVVAANMANAETTRTPQGGAYRRQLVVFRSHRIPQFPLLLASHSSRAAGGVEVGQVLADPSPPLVRTSLDILTPMPKVTWLTRQSIQWKR